jgi:hypothetical protein
VCNLTWLRKQRWKHTYAKFVVRRRQRLQLYRACRKCWAYNFRADLLEDPDQLQLAACIVMQRLSGPAALCVRYAMRSSARPPPTCRKRPAGSSRARMLHKKLQKYKTIVRHKEEREAAEAAAKLAAAKAARAAAKLAQHEKDHPGRIKHHLLVRDLDAWNGSNASSSEEGTTDESEEGSTAAYPRPPHPWAAKYSRRAWLCLH